MTVTDSWLFIGAVAVFVLCFGFSCINVVERFVAAIEKKRQS